MDAIIGCLRLKRACLAALVLALGGVLGCGGSSSAEGYAGLVQGLELAAMTGKPFDAVGRPADLTDAQRASLVAFCEVTRQLLAYDEGHKIAASAYYVARIKTEAEERLPAGSTHAVGLAVGRMDSAYGLRSLDPKVARRFVNACYR